MNNLLTQIDLLPPPQLPKNLTEEDRKLILLALASAKQQIRPYDGAFEAPWLLNSFSDLVWQTTNRGREELVNGEWQNAICIDWRIPLPNGATLDNSNYEEPLALIKQISFLMRQGLLRGNSTPHAWRNSVSKLILLFRWIFLHENKFLPRQYGLKLLDQASIDWLFSLIAEGGWIHALQIPQRLLIAMYQECNGTKPPQAVLDQPFNIPNQEIYPLIQWLESNNFYAKAKDGAHLGMRYVRREPLAKLICESASSFKGNNIGRFFRQFEPEFRNERLFIRIKQSTELPSQKIELADDFKNIEGSEESLVTLTKSFATILDAHRHVPTLLPEPGMISIRRAENIAKDRTRPSSHTLFMPVNTGLAYLNTAMRFVHVYGETIIGLYLVVISKYKPATANIGLNKHLNKYSTNFEIKSGIPITEILNITEFRRKEGNPDFNRIRSNPTLDEALRVLIGSCIVCLAILKPSREDELTHLKRDCLREYSGGGYGINFKLGKSNSGESWVDEDRPIPVITAKAIRLLQMLGDGLKKTFAEDRKIGDNLFYLPGTKGFGALVAHRDLLNIHLDIFCDYVGLPPDDEGRRWYVRIHEMRKWFLLLLFWSGRFDVLDAARWIAGHTDAEHIYAYIEKEFPGAELPRLEAEYSVERIYRRERERMRGGSIVGNEDGVDVLYEKILTHFKVESLTMIPESEWAGYVLSMRKDEKFRLEPHSIFGENDREVVGLNISFVMREET